MPKSVKKIKTTYEAVVWEGLNEQDFDGWGVTYFRDDRWNNSSLIVSFWDESKDQYHEEYLSAGDAVIRSSKGRTWVMNKDEYNRKFEDA